MKKKTYIIAEVGANHNGSFIKAKKYIDLLSKINVDAVKFQLSNPDLALSDNSFRAHYEKKSKGFNPKQNIIEEVKNRQLSLNHHKQLYKYCKKKNIDYLCSPFDLESLKFLINKLRVKKIKIPSGEILSLDFFNFLNNSKNFFEIIFSTGMASYNEIEIALSNLKKIKKSRIKILHCVSNYPTRIDRVNLSVIPEIKKRYKCDVGFSDHTKNNLTSVIAVALGARIIEKHVTLNKNLPGPDHKMSLNINEFKKLVLQIRCVEKMIGNKLKPITKEEMKIAKVARKSIVAKQDIKSGEIIKKNHICFKRPGTGILPIYFKNILNKKAKRFIKANTLILYKDIHL